MTVELTQQFEPEIQFELLRALLNYNKALQENMTDINNLISLFRSIPR